MTYLFGTAARQRLRDFSYNRSVVVFDFDGTLAPIVQERDHARMRPRTLALLNRLCTLYPCASISGRSLEDTRAHLQGAKIRVVYGSHGLEPGPHLLEYERLMTHVRKEIVLRFSDLSWVDIEDKRYSLAVHYRRALNRTDAHRRIRSVIAELTLPVRSVEGKCVVNLVPRDAPHKGDALVAIQRKFAATDVLFAGDDVTDEDAFRCASAHGWIGVRVGRSEHTCASYYVRRQREIDLLLARLIRLRLDDSPKRGSVRAMSVPQRR